MSAKSSSPRQTKAPAFASTSTSTGILSALDTLKLLVAPEAGLHSAKELGLGALQRATFVQLPLGVAFATREGTFIWSNEAFEAMLGRPPGSHRNCTIADLTHKDDASSHADMNERLWEGKIKSYSVESRYLKADGQWLWVRVSAAMVRTTEGEPVCSVGFLEDISARKQMEAEIERVQKELVTASRQAGMAEVATNVLHNVGNVLNSVNVSASILREKVKRSRGARLRDVAGMLVRHRHELPEFFARDQRAAKVPDFLLALATKLHAERKDLLREIEELRGNIDHITQTVSTQQTYAKRSSVVEEVPVVDLVEEAIRLTAAAAPGTRSVELRRDFRCSPCILTDKHKALQILVNLLRNAQQACEESGKPATFTLVRVDMKKSQVAISVVDNGVGITPDVMSKLFNHGFTTRKSGHGFGLHAAALTAAELGGTLNAQSEGPGRGANFLLKLPLKMRKSHP